MTRSSEVIPITGGRLALGTWQGIYVWEHRRAPHLRRLVVTVMGEGAGRGPAGAPLSGARSDR